MRFMLGTSAFSGILALIGIVFGYMVGLPAGLHFLLHGFMSNTPQIKALLSIQSYLSFIVTYLLGAALLFQLPLVFVLINRFKPLNARKLLTHQRWVILVAFIVGAIVSPSPDVRSQTIMSLPIIAMYELSVTIIWATNRKHKRPQYVADLLRRDTETRAARLARFQAAQAAWQQSLQASLPGTTSTPVAQPAKPEPIHDRPHQYLDFYQHPYATGR
jgi:Sec-independent protein secretion pathway component TatC